MLGVSRFYVINLEKALYDQPPGGILIELARLYKRSELELLEAYTGYVKEKRLEFKENYPSFKETFGFMTYPYAVHPLIRYREINGMSRAAFCKGLCLHPKTVEAYEKNKQRGIPEQLIVACNSIQWDYAPLESAVSEWRLNGYADRKGA